MTMDDRGNARGYSTKRYAKKKATCDSAANRDTWKDERRELFRFEDIEDMSR